MTIADLAKLAKSYDPKQRSAEVLARIFDKRNESESEMQSELDRIREQILRAPVPSVAPAWATAMQQAYMSQRYVQQIQQAAGLGPTYSTFTTTNTASAT